MLPEEATHATPPRSRPALWALSVKLARRGPLATLAIGISVVISFGGVVLAFVLARRGTAALEEVPTFVGSVLAWAGGVMLAFAASAHALRRDRDDGIRALIRARGGSLHSYLLGRVGGLVVVVGAVVVGGTLVTSIASTALASRAGIAAVAQASAAALLYAGAFSLTLGPVALAALGARSRAGGYLWLLGIVLVPELFEGWTSRILPAAWSDLGSIPSALAALRGALMPPGIDLAKVARAAVVIAVVIATALVIVRRQLGRLDAEEVT